MIFRLRVMTAIMSVTIFGLSAFFFFTYYIATDLVETNYAKSLNESLQLRMEQIDNDMRDAYQKTVLLSVQPEMEKIINTYIKDSNRDAEGALKVSEFLRAQNDSPDLIDALFLYMSENDQIVLSFSL